MPYALSSGNVLGTVTFGTTVMTFNATGGSAASYGLVAGTQYSYTSGDVKWVFNALRTTWQLFDMSKSPPKLMGSGTVS